MSTALLFFLLSSPEICCLFFQSSIPTCHHINCWQAFACGWRFFLLLFFLVFASEAFFFFVCLYVCMLIYEWVAKLTVAGVVWGGGGAGVCFCVCVVIIAFLHRCWCWCFLFLFFCCCRCGYVTEQRSMLLSLWSRTSFVAYYCCCCWCCCFCVLALYAIIQWWDCEGTCFVYACLIEEVLLTVS